MIKQSLIKKIIVLIMAISLNGAFIGCENEVVNDSNEEETEVSEPYKEEASKKSEAGDLKILTNDDLEAHFDDENGKYYLFDNKAGTGVEYPCIKFVDYKACKEVYLCNKLNCIHMDYDCTAVIPKEFRHGMSEVKLFGDKDYLYLFMQMEYSNGGMSVVEYVAPEAESLLGKDEKEKVYAPTIYRMKKDGTNRQAVFEFESGVSVEPIILSDGKYLYVVTMKTKDMVEGNATYSSSYDRQLMKIDLEEKSVEKILDLNSWQNIEGCSGRDVVLSERQFGQEVSAEYKYTHEEEYDKLYKKSKQIYNLFNLDNGKLTRIKELENSKEYSTCVTNQYFYVTYDNEKYIEKINLKNKKNQKIHTEKAFSLDGRTISVEGKPDTLLCWFKDKYYYVNSKTREHIKSTLTNRYKNPIEIISQSNDYLFVRYDYEKDINGEVHEYHYGMISKADFLNNVANYSEVDMIYSGVVY